MDSETGNTTELSEKPRERVWLFSSITREELDQLSDKTKMSDSKAISQESSGSFEYANRKAQHKNKTETEGGKS